MSKSKVVEVLVQHKLEEASPVRFQISLVEPGTNEIRRGIIAPLELMFGFPDNRKIRFRLNYSEHQLEFIRLLKRLMFGISKMEVMLVPGGLIQMTTEVDKPGHIKFEIHDLRIGYKAHRRLPGRLFFDFIGSII